MRFTLFDAGVGSSHSDAEIAAVANYVTARFGGKRGLFTSSVSTAHALPTEASAQKARRDVLWLSKNPGRMLMRRRDFVKAAIAAAAAWPISSHAETFPSRSITLIVPFAAGGPTDVLARILAEQMRRTLGQTVVIENVTGASGAVAGLRAARATPDGYTILIGHWGTHVLNGAVYSLQYDVLGDFEPIGLIGNGPQLIIGKPALPARNLQELIGWLKDNPNKATASGRRRIHRAKRSQD